MEGSNGLWGLRNDLIEVKQEKKLFDHRIRFTSKN
jgi:hypothetical protein